MAYYAKRKLPTTMWAGFSDGVMYMDAIPDTNHPAEFQGTLFFTKKQASRYFRDVRRVEIRVAQPKRRRASTRTTNGSR